MRPRIGVTLWVLMIGIWIGTISAQAASGYASPMIEANWGQAERVQPNFWGPLATARDGRKEPYKEAPGGQRLVQYFDKARMEQFDQKAHVTTGLLTVELKTGKVQLGDNTFEQRTPAAIGLAGDIGSDGPTYADLSKLKENNDVKQDSAALYRFNADHTFTSLTIEEEKQLILQTATFDALVSSETDPSGRYSQYVYGPFIDFINLLTDAGTPADQRPGYAISPIIVAQVPIGGKPTIVFIQAFERRVLTFNPNNPAAFRVEFGNIGQHYYKWRYGG